MQSSIQVICFYGKRSHCRSGLKNARNEKNGKIFDGDFDKGAGLYGMPKFNRTNELKWRILMTKFSQVIKFLTTKANLAKVMNFAEISD